MSSSGSVVVVEYVAGVPTLTDGGPSGCDGLFGAVFCKIVTVSEAGVGSSFPTEFLAFVSPDSSIVDSLFFPELGTDQAYCRFPDGDHDFVTTISPTPGRSNIYTRNVLKDSVYFSKESGHFPQ